VKFAEQNFVVVGAGQSGRAAAGLLRAQGAEVILNDAKPRSSFGDELIPLEAAGVKLVFGGHPASAFNEASDIVLSPGVPPLAVVQEAEAGGANVHSEVELASWFFQGQVVAITGTNGKSTVTTMIAEILRDTGDGVFAGGNLGTPLVSAVGSAAANPGGVVVAELSSFQLERVTSFRPDVAVLLNVTPDHMDRYDDFQHYARTKARIFGQQTPADYAIVPHGDPLCAQLASRTDARVCTFGEGDEPFVGVMDDHIRGPNGFRMALANLNLVGRHNHLNACAAVAAVLALGVSPNRIIDGLTRFQGLPHRVERVAVVDGVTYVDDSKATNVAAAAAAVRGIAGSFAGVWLIAGGRDKGGSYAELIEALTSCGQGVVAFGESGDLIEAAFSGSGTPVHRAKDMTDAVTWLAKSAKPGSAVLLAPACSSYDMYRSYIERGLDFQAQVLALGGAAL
jgi:UDP-N-acetylmuramoylalanine--D-glutamate ligase